MRRDYMKRKYLIKYIGFLILAPVFLLIFTNPIEGQSSTIEECNFWQVRVDSSIKLSENAKPITDYDEKNINQKTFIKAVECLLKLKGNKSDSRFPYAGVSFSLSERIPSPTVEVSALYYISYLYYQNFHHSRAMLLIDKEGYRNKESSIETAYKSYADWFEKIKKIGLKKARKQKLDPLAGSGVSWY